MDSLQNRFSLKNKEIVKAIFKHYKLIIKEEHAQTLADALYEVVFNKKRYVGARIKENSVRLFP